MKTAFALLAALALAMPAAAQTVKLPDQVAVQPGRLAAVAVEYDGDDVKWTASADLDVFREYDPNPKVIRLRLIGYAAGKFELAAVTCKGGKLSDFARCVITVGSPTPPPPPPPPPPPVTQKVTWALVVADKSKLPPAIADPAAWESLGVKWHLYDLADALPGGLKARADAAGSYPALVLCADAPVAGQPLAFLRAVPLPPTIDALKKEIAK